MIRFEELVVRYPRAARDALAGVTFAARRGALTAVVGPNGSGKSTLVRALIRRIVPRSGKIVLGGHDVGERGGRLPDGGARDGRSPEGAARDGGERDVADIPRRELATRVAVVTQREELAFPATAAEYVALGRFPHLGDWRALGERDREAVRRAAALAGIEPLLDRAVDSLSGGEWQRVRLARALAQEGEAIVLDEPTTFLDIAHEMAAFELLARLARDGQAVLLVSHQLNLVARFADRIVLLHEGTVAADGPPNDVMQASILERVYDWPLVVTRDPAVGAPALLPLRGRSRG